MDGVGSGDPSGAHFRLAMVVLVLFEAVSIFAWLFFPRQTALLAQAARRDSDALRTREAEARSRIQDLGTTLSMARPASQEALAGKAAVEEWSSKLRRSSTW